MNDATQIATALWRPFLSKIETGDPVFLCFHREMLGEVFRSSGIPFDQPGELVNTLVRQLVSIDGDDIEINPQVFEEGPSGFSLAIILACQQVLVVEDMVRDSNGFSENAYFPRLRSMISKNLQPLSLNPFSFEDFEQVWRQIAKEILKVKGSTERSVTFSFGIETGINKARSFPLSQALLSRDDLFSIVAKLGIQNVKLLTHDQLWKSIRQERFSLPRRAQRLLGLPFLKDRIVEQVRSFSKTVDPKKFEIIIPGNTVRDTYSLGLFKEPIDWQHEEYRVFLSKPTSSQRIFDETNISQVLDDIFRRKGFLILPPVQSGDVWVKHRQMEFIQPGATFLIVGSNQDISKALNMIKTLWPSFNPDQVDKYQLAGRANEIVVEVNWNKNMSDSIRVFDGTMTTDRTDYSKNNFDWVGGVCIDQRSNSFLRAYLPEKIKFGPAEYNLNEAKKVNGASVSLQDVLEKTAKFEGRTNLELEFPNGLVGRISIEPIEVEDRDRMGFPILDTGKISPVLDRVQPGAVALIGFGVPPKESTPLTSLQLSILLKSLNVNEGVILSDVHCKEIEARLVSSPAPIEVKTILLQFIRGRKRLSPQILEELDISI